MNHFSLDHPPSDTLLYTSMDPHKPPFPFFYPHPHQHHQPPSRDDSSDQSSSAAANDTASSSADHRDPMFEKPLTPSDVGKLNRLVIPKQHAEKYFPLSGSTATAASADGGSGGGGILLGFEDECGKCWRFRYSYWNSSQSYVLTKGWSRYVKEKKLDAGDVVFFDRHRFEPDRFFIGWRRRGAPAQPRPEFGGWSSSQSQRASYNTAQAQVHQGYLAPQPHRIAASYPYLPADSFHAGTEVRQQRQSQKAARSGAVNQKRLRLFGVNLECQLEEDDQDAEPQTSDGSSLSSQGPALGLGSGSGSGPSGGPLSYNYFDYMGYPPNHHNHMDMNFPQDVNQMGNRLG